MRWAARRSRPKLALTLSLVSLKGPFESSKCYACDKRKPVFNFAKGAFSKVDLGLLRKML